MITFLPPTKPKKKNDASKTGLLNIGTPPVVVPRKEAPPTWHHHQPQPGSKSSSFKRQCGKFRGTDSPGSQQWRWLGWRVKFFWGKERLVKILFHHKNYSEVKGYPHGNEHISPPKWHFESMMIFRKSRLVGYVSFPGRYKFTCNMCPIPFFNHL